MPPHALHHLTKPQAAAPITVGSVLHGTFNGVAHCYALVTDTTDDGWLARRLRRCKTVLGCTWQWTDVAPHDEAITISNAMTISEGEAMFMGTDLYQYELYSGQPIGGCPWLDLSTRPGLASVV